MKVLGTPLGSPEYVSRLLAEKREEHDRLLQLIPDVPDLQSAWLLLLLSASTRANYLLRALPPTVTREYAAQHDAAIAACLQRLLANDTPAVLAPLHIRRAQLALRLGGLGLRSAVRTRAAAYWASWADTIPLLRSRLPGAATRVLDMLDGRAHAAANSVQELTNSTTELVADGFDAPP